MASTAPADAGPARRAVPHRRHRVRHREPPRPHRRVASARLRRLGELPAGPGGLRRHEQPAPRRGARGPRHPAAAVRHLLAVVAVPHLPHHGRRRRGALGGVLPHAPSRAARPRAGGQPDPPDGRASAGGGQARGRGRGGGCRGQARVPLHRQRGGGARRHPAPRVGSAPRRGARGGGPHERGRRAHACRGRRRDGRLVGPHRRRGCRG